MCITTPAKVTEINGNKALVELKGKTIEVRIDLVDVAVGDYVYCAAGMAVEKAVINMGYDSRPEGVRAND
jgi:hydrogenase assembly chaperone HypC/HupF